MLNDHIWDCVDAIEMVHNIHGEGDAYPAYVCDNVEYPYLGEHDNDYGGNVRDCFYYYLPMPQQAVNTLWLESHHRIDVSLGLPHLNNMFEFSFSAPT